MIIHNLKIEDLESCPFHNFLKYTLLNSTTCVTIGSEMRIVFMGTDDFALPALESLFSSEHQIVAVYTQPDKPAGRGRGLLSPAVKKRAQAHGLSVYQPLSLKQLQEQDRLANLRPEVIIVAAFGQILPRSVLDIPPFGCINIHPSLLPRHRGPSPVAATILAGDGNAGVSLMLLDEGMDTGPVLAQQQVPISSKDTTGSLTARLAQIGAQLLMNNLPLWIEGNLIPEPQDNEKATYSRLIGKEDGKIDWHLPAAELWRRVRAFQPWPGCYTTWQGKLMKIIEAVPLPGGKDEPGRVSAINEPQAYVGVQAGEGVLGLLQIQLEGKRTMAAEEFVRGQRSFIGALLPC